MQVLKGNSTEYNIDPGQIVISGFSAGGHLAALYSSICRKDGHPCPQAQVLLSVPQNRGKDIQSWCFPEALVNKDTPPTVIFHSSGDMIVPEVEITDFVGVWTATLCLLSEVPNYVMGWSLLTKSQRSVAELLALKATMHH